MSGFSESELDQIADALASRGYVALKGVLPSDLCHRLADEIRLQVASGFREAAIGKGHERHPEIRSDRTKWWDFDSLTLPQAEFNAWLSSLKDGLNQRLFLGLWDIEGHYAIYEPGAGYQKHLDRFRNDSARKVSCVAFFNRGWKPEDGGELRLEFEGGEERVLPEAGTLVVFLSDRIPHEVMTTRRERLSFAGWFRERRS